MINPDSFIVKSAELNNGLAIETHLKVIYSESAACRYMGQHNTEHAVKELKRSVGRRILREYARALHEMERELLQGASPETIKRFTNLVQHMDEPLEVALE